MIHSSPENQFDTLLLVKKWWKSVLIVFVLGLVVISTVYYWHIHNQAQIGKASITFDRLVSSLSTKKPESIKELVAFARAEKNTYGILAALKAAQFYVVELSDFQGANALLEDALTKTNEETLQNIILIRIARLQHQQNLDNQSLQTLDRIKSDNWTAMVNNIRGDIFSKQRKYTDSAAAYKMALSADPVLTLKTNIEIKLNQTLYLIEKMRAKETEILTEKRHVTGGKVENEKNPIMKN